MRNVAYLLWGEIRITCRDSAQMVNICDDFE